MTQPIISCIMPCNRPEDLPRAIEVFKAQDWENKELIIVPYGFDVINAITPTRNISVGVSKVFTQMSVGAMRNYACTLAKGDIIMHQDSDDFFAPDYLTHAYNHLMQSGADITGLSSAYFYQEPDKAWLYEYNGSLPYVIGSGMMYHKSVWQRKLFQDVNEGEDTLFISNNGKISPHGYTDGFVAFIHGKNTASHKQLHRFKPVNVSAVSRILAKSAAYSRL